MSTGSAVVVPAPPQPRYPGGCSLEPAPFTLDFLVNWRADVGVNGVIHEGVVVLEFLRALLRAPESYGISPETAGHARERFLELAAPLLEQQGGQRAWLEREFER